MTEWTDNGIAEVTVKEVPMKPPFLARIKSNNYLLNALTAMAEWHCWPWIPGHNLFAVETSLDC